MAIGVFEEIQEESLKQKIRDSFVSEILRLKALGFTEDYYAQMELFPLSALLLAPFTIYMFLKGVPLGVTKFLQAIELGVFLVHQDGYAYGLPDKIHGTKYVTLFDDNTMLTTTVHQTLLQHNPQNRFLCQVSKSPTLESAWQQHIDKVSELAEEGYSVIAPLTIKDLLKMEYRAIHPKYEDKEKRKNKR